MTWLLSLTNFKREWFEVTLTSIALAKFSLKGTGPTSVVCGGIFTCDTESERSRLLK